MMKRVINLVLAILANIWYRFPSRKITLIGITGSNCREATALYSHAILLQTSKNVGLITPSKQTIISVHIPDHLKVNSDVPNPFKLQRLLRELVYRGCKYGILTVSAESLHEKRLWGCNFTVTVLTNYNHQSGYFDSNEQHLHAKSKLFTKTPLVVLNKDDPSYSFLSRLTQGKRITYGIKNEAQIKAAKIQNGSWGSFFYYTNKESVWKNQLSIDRSIKLQDKNLDVVPCALAAIGIAAALNIPEFRIKKGLESV
ncbi:hypothetical protein KJ608_00585 [Patescibacteria group bacterium]|nr:hypothetical protein [Patescibacteria group bacterium]